MGIFSRAESPSKKSSVEAQYAPQVLGEYSPYAMPFQYAFVSREDALSVPALQRCRNLLAGTIGAIPLELYRKSTNEELGSPVWLEQPSYSQPRSVTIAYTVESLLLYGQAFWQVVEVYNEDGRPSRFEWIANNRVTATLDSTNTFVKSYAVDGTTLPMDGLGSLITFQSLLPGILNTGIQTIRAAIDVQKAAAIAASTPMATGYIKNTGADLDPKEVSGLLAAWRTARNNRSTAYLTSTLEYKPVSFSPKEMMYSEAIFNLATEIARLCNVPAYYVSADQNNSMTYANVQDERKQFLTLSLQPFISAIEDRLSMDDITARGNVVKFDIDKNFLRTDPLQELAVIEKLLTLELITQEQAMEMTDLTPNGSQGMECGGGGGGVLI
jgi:HK97 family phage portal protein